MLRLQRSRSLDGPFTGVFFEAVFLEGHLSINKNCFKIPIHCSFMQKIKKKRNRNNKPKTK
jgi:hypothetical protein